LALYTIRTVEGKNKKTKTKDKRNGELLVGEDEMMIVRSIVSCCLLKLKRNQKEKRHLKALYNGRRKKIMKTTLMLHASEGHENRKTFSHIKP
jgi:hypothetical protein